MRSGDAQREARCDAGSECGGESPATEALSEAGGADCMELCVCVGSRFGERLDGHQTTVTPLLTQKGYLKRQPLNTWFSDLFLHSVSSSGDADEIEAGDGGARV